MNNAIVDRAELSTPVSMSAESRLFIDEKFPQTFPRSAADHSFPRLSEIVVLSSLPRGSNLAAQTYLNSHNS